MRAIVLEKFGGLDSLVYVNIPEPWPKPGYVVIQIKAFGSTMPKCPGGEFPIGAKVAALMDGLGRTINGSYAEYICAPVPNAALIEADLPWAELVAIPETYAAAWICLSAILRSRKSWLAAGHRGATSFFGQAALKVRLTLTCECSRPCVAGTAIQRVRITPFVRE